jgi:D-3-phosphoglycerate dehydrogenase
MKNQDVPGVIGYIGSVLGKHGINIANFSLGRGDEPSKDGEPLEAVAVIETDSSVPQKVLEELLTRPALKVARTVEFGTQAGAAAS